jgi:predicted HicB family RNase H-like nuclease
MPRTVSAANRKGRAGSSPAEKTTRKRKKATFNLDADLHQRLKVHAAVQGREMVSLVEEALKTYLGRLGASKTL